MNTKLILRTMGLFILITSLLVFLSCTKTAKEQNEQQDKNLETSSIDETDFTETDEDLTTVDYKEFYDQLSPYGEWVQVKSEEIGLQSKTAQSISPGNNNFSLSNLLGIKEANASTGVNVEMAFVWKPSTDLAVVSDGGDVAVYEPYTNGQWVYTDAGWYFKAPTPEEEIVHHYGRWVNSVTDGWLWVPGRVWAPAWVDWRQNDGYVAWTPVPPSVYIVNNYITVPPIEEDRYIIVEKKYFVEPQVYKYKYMYKENKNKIMIKEMTKTNRVMIKNKTIINKGPEVSDIERYWGNKIEIVKINRVKDKNDVKYSDNEYYVYTPTFTKVKHTENVKTPVFQPKTFVKYDEWNERKSEDKEYRKEEKEMSKENNGKDNGQKYDDKDKGQKYDDKDKGKKNDDKDKGKKNDDKDKGKKNDDVDKGKDKGNEKIKQHNGNDKKKGNK